MDRTNRDGKSSEPGLDETLPSGEHAGLPSSEHTGLEETLASGDHGPSPLRIGDQSPSSLTRSTGGPRASLPHIERGTAIGRYTVVERIGSGTMGLVLAAFDPTLDRKVAIKLVQLDPTGTTSGRQRLLREAQAMAKLQHPNVVTVFEVGTFEDRVFLAMEYVAGSTLHDWLSAERSHREIIAAFVAAGHGLAAAHRAGIVHRDFKPANVLVDGDGRVRVADFGLATAPTDAPPPPVAVSRDSNPGPLGMTKTGAVLGTPAYMSPEQHRGAPADARADQFAFCVALYEALYKALPFEGGTFLIYQDNVLAGRVREPARGSDVPPRIRRVLLRGLAVSPADRYPDMDALLADLSHDPVANRKRLAWLGAALLAGVGTTLAIAKLTGGDDDPCKEADAPLASLWNPAQKRDLEASFRASGSPGAAASFAQVSSMLDERATALRAARREACVATAVRHEQSAELLDRRIQCVDDRATATTAMIDVMIETHDIDVLMRGISAVMKLPAVETCSDRATLLSDAPAPPPENRAQIKTLDQRTAKAEAMLSAGMATQALDLLTAIAREADPLEYAPLSARVHTAIADAYIDLDQTEKAIVEIRRSGELAAAARDDVQAALTWTTLFSIVASKQGKFDEARGIEQVAAAAVVRAGNTPELVGTLEQARGIAALWREEYEPAARHFQAAAKSFERGGRPLIARRASALQNAGDALTWSNKFDEARPLLEQSLAIRVETLGNEHPAVANSHHALGVLLDTSGKPDQALPHFEKGATITGRVFPADSAHNAKAHVSLGLVLAQLERADEAVDHHKRAVEIFEKHLDDNRQYMSTALFNLGLAYIDTHEYKQSVATLQRALTFAEEVHGADSGNVASVLNGLIPASDLAGDHEKAFEYGKRALAIREKDPGPDKENLASVLGDLAQNANFRGKPQEALQLIDRALAIAERPGAPEVAMRFEMRKIRATALVKLRRADAAVADAKKARDGYVAANQPTSGAAAQLVLADALWLQGKRSEAIAEATAALATVQAQPKPDAETIAKARDWLAKHAK